jgi:hypothetical protein
LIFLEPVEISDWCRTHGVSLAADDKPSTPSPSSAGVVVFGTGRRLSHASATEIAHRHIDALGAWDEALLWITEWDVWPSSVDWPEYYAARGKRGEQRSLHIAPGHLFIRGEQSDVEQFLTMVIRNGWDAHLIASLGGRVTKRIFASHDEWIYLHP